MIARGDILAASGRIAARRTARQRGPRAARSHHRRRRASRSASSSTACRRRRSRSRTSRSRRSTSRAAICSAARRDLARGRRRQPRRSAVRRGERSTRSLMLGDCDRALADRSRCSRQWPASRRARIALAQIVHRAGASRPTPSRILDEGDRRRSRCRMGSRCAATRSSPPATRVGAAADFDAALKKIPTHEPAIDRPRVARARDRRHRRGDQAHRRALTTRRARAPR